MVRNWVQLNDGNGGEAQDLEDENQEIFFSELFFIGTDTELPGEFHLDGFNQLLL